MSSKAAKNASHCARAEEGVWRRVRAGEEAAAHRRDVLEAGVVERRRAVRAGGGGLVERARRRRQVDAVVRIVGKLELVRIEGPGALIVDGRRARARVALLVVVKAGAAVKARAVFVFVEAAEQIVATKRSFRELALRRRRRQRREQEEDSGGGCGKKGGASETRLHFQEPPTQVCRSNLL